MPRSRPAPGSTARPVVLHLDVQLHQAVLTELAGHGVLRRRRVEIAPRAGLKAMYAAWAQLVSEAMVRRTRFDPLHQAASEQQLYERLPAWLDALAAARVRGRRRRSGSGSYSATVRREQFTLAAEAWYAQLDDLVRGLHRADEPATLALSARAARLPALARAPGGGGPARGRARCRTWRPRPAPRRARPKSAPAIRRRS